MFMQKKPVNSFVYVVQNPEVDAEVLRSRYTVRQKSDWRLSSLWAVLGLEVPDNQRFEAFTEHFHTLDELSVACRRAGLEESNLIIGVDFTASNEWQGRKSFNQNCLHKTQGNLTIMLSCANTDASVVSSGGSRIFLRGGANSQNGINFFQLFAKNCMKMK